MIQHYDALGQPIQVGDQIILNWPGSTTLCRGTVIKLTPKMVTIQFRSWEISKNPKSIVVINKQHEYALETWPELYV